MYGIVLMAALATGSGTPSADATPPAVVVPMATVPYMGCFSSGCCGGVMLSGGCYSSGCCGGSYSGCYSSSCNGCGGGSGFLGLRSRMSGLFNRSSCSGCYSSSCYGSSCFGSACYGGGCYGGAHYYGSDFHGGYSPAPVYGTGAIIGAATPRQSVEYSAARTKPDAAPARLTIDVPAEAKLFVDGQLTKGEGTTRNFHTPDLADGQTFFYELKAVVMVDGRPVSESKRVLVRSGEAYSESFPKLVAAIKDPALLASKAR